MEAVTDLDAVVIGSGPNGLAAAITLARAGRSVRVLEANDHIGGGMRSGHLDDEVIYDICSAVHPLGAGSPFFRSLPLDDLGVHFDHAEIPFTQPLDGGRAGVAFRSVDETADALGASDGRRYRQLIKPFVDRWWDLAGDVMGPIVRRPDHPITLTRFGIPALLPSSVLARRFQSDEARALLAGPAAHSIVPLNSPLTGSAALVFLATAHAVGWPVVRGGSQQLADGMVAELERLGGQVDVGHHVTSMADLPAHRAALFNTTPGALVKIAGNRVSGRWSKAATRFRHGSGAFKIDYILAGPVPWADPFSARAGTVHLGGTFEEIAAAEAEVSRGGHPDRPFVLVAQPNVADSSRTPDDRHVLWAYTHVPAGSTVDMTASIEAQLERFAPGFSDLITKRQTTTTAGLEAYNANYVGGDIAGGTVDGLQAVRRPVLGPNPYRTPDPSIFLCSASTPPGAGVHGMAGFHAANRALSGILA